MRGDGISRPTREQERWQKLFPWSLSCHRIGSFYMRTGIYEFFFVKLKFFHYRTFLCLHCLFQCLLGLLHRNIRAYEIRHEYHLNIEQRWWYVDLTSPPRSAGPFSNMSSSLSPLAHKSFYEFCLKLDSGRDRGFISRHLVQILYLTQFSGWRQIERGGVKWVYLGIHTLHEYVLWVLNTEEEWYREKIVFIKSQIKPF